MTHTYSERRGLTYVSICHGLLHVLELTYGVVLVSVADDLGVTFLVMGIIANVFGFAYGLTALPVGVLADRASETRLLSVCAIGMGVAAVVVSLAQGVVSLGIGLCVLGVALGLFHPVGSAFVSRTATNTGIGFAYLGVGGNLGLALGPIMAGAIASGFGWRIAYATFAVPCVILGLLFMRLPQRHSDAVVKSDAAVDADSESLRPYLVPLGLILLVTVMIGLVYRGVVTFLPSYLSGEGGLSIAGMDPVMLAGSFTTVALLFGVGGQFVGGYLSDRHRREAIALVSSAVSVPALLAVWYFGGVAMLGAAATFAFFHFMSQPVFNALIADYSPDRWRGRMYGIYFFCAFGVGSFSASLLGFVVESYGVEIVFLVCAGIAALAALFTIPLLARAMRRNTLHRDTDVGHA